MARTRIKLLLFVFSLLTLLPTRVALADTGPKPTMDFAFQQAMTEEPPLVIRSGILYECDQPDCSDASPLQEAGPQRFSCDVNRCYALAYGFARYHRLEIEFSDGKTRQSNIFRTAGFDSQYTVTIRPDDLLVEAEFNVGVFSRIALILIVCLCALMAVGLGLGAIFFLVRRAKKN